MKKTILLILLSLKIHAAIATGVVWEVRHSGSDSNGGGFITGASGTDFSQQDSAQYTFTDLASTSGTTNPCIVTSASHNFVAADVGNIMQITAGTNWTASFFQIVSTATNAATLDRACGSSATLSGGTFAVGGALGTVGKINTVFGVTTAINQIAYVKADATYVIAAGISYTNGPTGNNNFGQIIGYTTTRGDNGQFTLQASGTGYTLLQMNGVAITLYNAVADCNSKSSSTGFQMQNGNPTLINVETLNCTQNGITMAGGQSAMCVSCLAVGTTGGIGISLNARSQCWFCRATGGTTEGIELANAPCFYCIADSNTGIATDGFNVAGYNNGYNSYCLGCIAYKNGRDGFRFTQVVQPNGQTVLMNSISVLNTGNGISNTGAAVAAGALVMDYNAVYSNTAGNYHNLTAGTHDVLMTADPFVNGTAGDFTLNNAPGGGAAIRTTGFPGHTPMGKFGAQGIGPVGSPILQ